jgi:hypothetical protein
VRHVGELGGDVAGVEGVDEQKLAASEEQSDGVGDEVTELVLDVTGDRIMGDGGSTGAKWVGPGGRACPLLNRGDGLFSGAAPCESVDGNEFLLLVLES